MNKPTLLSNNITLSWDMAHAADLRKEAPAKTAPEGYPVVCA